MILQTILDIILAIILLVGLIVGYKRGFVKAISAPVRFFASLLTSFWLVEPISEKVLEPMIKTPVTNQINSYLLENCASITPESAAEDLPTLLKFAASALDVDVTALSSENTIAAIVDALASPVVHIISMIVSFIVIYFVAKLVYKIVLAMLSPVFAAGPLSVPNKLLGCVFTLFIAAIFAWLLTLVFDFAVHSSLFAGNTAVQEFEGGFIYGFFNKHNPVDMLLGF